MVKYVEISNAFRAADSTASEERYLVFIADNALRVENNSSHDGAERVSIRINKINVEVATIFFNEARCLETLRSAFAIAISPCNHRPPPHPRPTTH